MISDPQERGSVGMSGNVAPQEKELYFIFKNNLFLA